MNNERNSIWYIIGGLILLVLVIGGVWWYAKMRNTEAQTGAAAQAMQGWEVKM